MRGTVWINLPSLLWLTLGTPPVLTSERGSCSLKNLFEEACEDLLEFERFTESTFFLVFGLVIAEDATLYIMFLLPVILI